MAAAGVSVISTVTGNSDRADAAPAASRIVCPDVAGRLSAIPAQAAEVDRNLARLGVQICRCWLGAGGKANVACPSELSTKDATSPFASDLGASRGGREW